MKFIFENVEELKVFAKNFLGLSETPATATVAEPITAPTTAKIYSRDEIVNAAIPLVDSHFAELQTLMSKYGIATVNDLAESQFGAFAADIRALGGTI